MILIQFLRMLKKLIKIEINKFKNNKNIFLKGDDEMSNILLQNDYLYEKEPNKIYNKEKKRIWNKI